MIRLGLRFLVLGGWSLAALLSLLCSLPAQGPLQPPPGQEAYLGSLDHKLNNTESGILNEMRNGKASPKESKKNAEIVTKAAMWYVYRLTDTKYHEDKDKNPEKATMSKLVDDFFDVSLISIIRKNQLKKDDQPEHLKQQDYIKAFARESLVCLREVLAKNAKPIVRVNAARMVAGLAETGQEEVADTLLDLLKNDPENAGAQLYALRGLKEMFDRQYQSPRTASFKDPKRERACILALIQFVARPRPAHLPADAPADEVAGFQYVRREAIRALGLTRYPQVPGSSGVEGMTALWLVRAIAKGELPVESSLTERAEASIGICQLQLDQSNESKNYQPDYAAYQIGLFLLDYAQTYNAQRVSKIETLPWKLYTTRLVLALDNLTNQAKSSGNSASAAFITAFVPVAKTMLRDIEFGKDNTDPTALEGFLRNTKLPSQELFRGMKESVLKAGS